MNADSRDLCLSLAAGGCVLLSLSPGVVLAEPAAKAVLEEIVVTAKQRQESLQDVPLSVTAYDGDALRQGQIADLRDLAQFTPGLNMASGAGRNDPSAVSLRGIAPNTSDERYQGVSVFIDGVPLSGQLMSLDLTQVERIEVLKGPQSATFGRATYTGAINYITRDPSEDEITGNVRVRGGRNQDALAPNYYFGASATVPVVPGTFWLGLQGVAFGTGGLDRDPQDRSPIGREQTRSGVLTMYFRPSEAVSLKGRFSFDFDKDSAASRHVQHPREWLSAGVPVVRLPRAGNAPWPTRIPDVSRGVAASLDEGVGPPIDGGNERQRSFGSLIARYEREAYEFSYTGGWFRSLDRRVANFFSRATQPGVDPVYGSLIGRGVTINPVVLSRTASLAGREIFENTSHQLLVVSPAEARLRWRAGLYRWDERNDNWFLGFATPANPSGKTFTQEFDNTAAFGGLDFDVVDGLTVGIEGRYQRENLVWRACPTCVLASTVRDETRRESDFLPRATVEWQVTPDNMLYALFSKGTKSGRLSNTSIVVGGQPDFVYATPERLDNYEVGSKNTFWDGRALLNVAVYRLDVTDQQLTTTQDVLTSVGTRAVTSTFNVSESRVNGIEIESTVRPIEPLTLSVGVGYADQEFTTADPVVLSPAAAVVFPGAPGSPVVLQGRTQANVPTWNGHVSAAWQAPLGGSGLDLAVRADGLYRGSFYGDLANVAQVPDSWKVNARVAAVRAGRWEAALYGRNLFNDLTTTVTGLGGSAGTCTYFETNTATYGTSQQCVFSSQPRARELGIEFSISF